ncbi:hypothetical protein CDAR_413911 [Caerostris darwini]|uniref:Uncharacterized protein n=1 Tax=Caerostris darwini TaxID=1538125 RepID=A0AAV4RAD0_9ARAC|nr:hypothetical protein CDAR_413911 [Caerostris darwini]
MKSAKNIVQNPLEVVSTSGEVRGRTMGQKEERAAPLIRRSLKHSTKRAFKPLFARRIIYHGGRRNPPLGTPSTLSSSGSGIVVGRQRSLLDFWDLRALSS